MGMYTRICLCGMRPENNSPPPPTQKVALADLSQPHERNAVFALSHLFLAIGSISSQVGGYVILGYDMLDYSGVWLALAIACAAQCAVSSAYLPETIKPAERNVWAWKDVCHGFAVVYRDGFLLLLSLSFVFCLGGAVSALTIMPPFLMATFSYKQKNTVFPFVLLNCATAVFLPVSAKLGSVTCLGPMWTFQVGLVVQILACALFGFVAPFHEGGFYFGSVLFGAGFGLTTPAAWSLVTTRASTQDQVLFCVV